MIHIIQGLGHTYNGKYLALIGLMRTVIIVTMCTKIIRLSSSDIWYQFHFHGVWHGERIRQVKLLAEAGEVYLRGEEYLLYVGVTEIERGELRGVILKSKRLADCWDKS